MLVRVVEHRAELEVGVDGEDLGATRGHVRLHCSDLRGIQKGDVDIDIRVLVSVSVGLVQRADAARWRPRRWAGRHGGWRWRRRLRRRPRARRERRAAAAWQADGVVVPAQLELVARPLLLVRVAVPRPHTRRHEQRVLAARVVGEALAVGHVAVRAPLAPELPGIGGREVQREPVAHVRLVEVEGLELAGGELQPLHVRRALVRAVEPHLKREVGEERERRGAARVDVLSYGLELVGVKEGDVEVDVGGLVRGVRVEAVERADAAGRGRRGEGQTRWHRRRRGRLRRARRTRRGRR